jgi:hypothetical protein
MMGLSVHSLKVNLNLTFPNKNVTTDSEKTKGKHIAFKYKTCHIMLARNILSSLFVPLVCDTHTI